MGKLSLTTTSKLEPNSAANGFKRKPAADKAARASDRKSTAVDRDIQGRACPSLGDLLAKNLAELKRVEKLSLAGSGLNDAGIKHLATLTNLESLDLRRTKATAIGINELKGALPGCRIEWDGGVIEPK